MKTATIALGLCLVATGVYLVAKVSVTQAQRPALAATGQALDANRQQLAGVPLQVEGPNGKNLVVTDRNGFWYLYNLPSGTYKISTMSNLYVGTFAVEKGKLVTAPSVTVPR